MQTQDAIKRKIRALLSKTEDKGCTEAEAMAAAELAAKLMAEHDIAYVEPEDAKKDKYGVRRRQGYVSGSHRRVHTHEVLNLVVGVARFFDCKVWYENSPGGSLCYFGSEFDTEQAHQLTFTLYLALNTEWAKYSAVSRFELCSDGPISYTKRIHGKSLRMSFMRGMCNRIHYRLSDLKKERAKAVEQLAGVERSTALVLVKAQATEEAYTTWSEQNKFKLGKANASRKSEINMNAYSAGFQAGGNVALGQKEIK